jgi:TPR repeat protein
MLFHGVGILMNNSLAAHYFKLSADQRFVNAQWVYANCLLSGIGVEINADIDIEYM